MILFTYPSIMGLKRKYADSTASSSSSSSNVNPEAQDVIDAVPLDPAEAKRRVDALKALTAKGGGGGDQKQAR